MPAAPGPSAIDSPRVTRFAADLAAIWPAGRAQGRLGIAVSGGPDSLALLLLANAALPGRIAAATVDHGLRPESAAEAAMVAKVCARLGIDHATLSVTLADGNLQAEARTARYAAMEAWMGEQGIAALATAHHADDQAETLLMRLNRGSGVSGLAGVRAVSRLEGGALLLRPLLGWRRAELAAVVREAGLEAVDDPSNANPRFDRARLRQVLASADWLDVPAIAQSAAHLADADAALNWAARREWQECVKPVPMGLAYRPQAPKAVALKVLARVVTELGGEEPRGSAIARLFDSLLAGQPASIGSLVARAGPDGWTFTSAPVRRAPKPSA